MSPAATVAVFGSSQTKHGSAGWEEAEAVGRELAGNGFAVVTGGYGGTMEAVSRGAAAVGGKVIGVIAPRLFPSRHGANPYVTNIIEADTLTDRIGIMTEMADGAMALPGSIGTATELLVAWNINHVARRAAGQRLPTVAVGAEWAALAEILSGDIGAHGGDVHLSATVDEGLVWLLGQLKNRQY